ncbi:TadE/TadG family type IV pilus assembly protein [Bacillus sp. FJAT-26390]|uniref:TadE/TadG family type IV pilus assembly protein n=1 Tax=Bacillus sp. FJAT-26390 TaxID=1743142 RepID=UPI000807E264|nr:TadE/TadG family type IV pilus assembly protein [Bacillus sp. FJAT-26390]OBZ16013.1 hypothetical protein A7975_29715 [Bacillus sp. FJAT-26390]
MSRIRMRARLLDWLKREQGSFTLESTIVFPMLLGLILLFILFGMYMYQKVVLYYAASASAERAAFGWDNSYREARNGMLSELSYDGLYWRIGEDERLKSLFGTGGEKTDAAVRIPPQSSDEASENALPVRKMEQSVRWIGQAGLSYEGQMSYFGGVLKRVIEVKLKSPFSNRSVEKSWLRREAMTVTSAAIVDPVEFIRSVDLVRYYTKKFADGTGGARSQAGEVLAPYKETKVRKP